MFKAKSAVWRRGEQKTVSRKEKGVTAKAATPCFFWCPWTESNRRHEDFQLKILSKFCNKINAFPL
jgi:hypothetical protein